MTYFKIENLSFSYDDIKIFENFNLELKKGEILIIKGKSGIGKTTLLRIISGLEKDFSGKIYLDSKDITKEKIENRKISYLFQNYTLFPHMTVEKNILYANKNADVKFWLDFLNLKGFEKKYPHMLSGGQYQRISLAMTISTNPKLILLDEPFSNIDKELRAKLSKEMQIIFKKFNITAIIVSHDTEELEKISSNMIVLS